MGHAQSGAGNARIAGKFLDAFGVGEGKRAEDEAWGVERGNGLALLPKKE
jgi:hypothetical protein